MAARATLSQDNNSRPGYGTLRVSGWGSEPGDQVELRIESNQHRNQHLQPSGDWGVSPAMQTVEVVASDDASFALALGPNIINALVKNASSAFQAFIEIDGKQKPVPLRQSGRLLGSSAAQDVTPNVEIAVPAPDIQAETRVDVPNPVVMDVADADDTAVIAPVLMNDNPKKSIKLIVVALILLVAVTLATAWALCYLPVKPASCTVAPALLVAPASEEATPYDIGVALLNDEKPKEAQIQFRLAVKQNNNVDAMKRLAEMYDPSTWDTAKSPADAAEWETANWWWNKAAALGDKQAQRRAGYNMMKYSSFAVEREKGEAMLQELAEAQDADAVSMLKELQGE